MKYRLVVYGVLVVALAIAWSVERRAYKVNDTTEILIVANPINPLNPVVANPYQTEYEQMLYPTVRITAGFSTGSGVIFTTKSTKDTKNTIYILTAHHVVEDENTVNIELYNSTVITASVILTDTAKDLALLCALCDLCGESIYSASLAPESYQAYLFTPIYTVGCSLGLLPRPSQGIISAINTDSWEVSSPILPGNSGGPVYDARTYEVIGIAVWVKTYQGQLVTTMAGVVLIQQVHEFLNHKEHQEHKE